MTDKELNIIKNQILMKTLALGKVQRKIRTLHPIDVQSTTGRELYEERNEIRGEIKSLKWALKEFITR